MTTPDPVAAIPEPVLCAMDDALGQLPQPGSRFERDRWRIVSRAVYHAVQPLIRADEREHVAGALGRAMGDDASLHLCRAMLDGHSCGGRTLAGLLGEDCDPEPAARPTVVCLCGSTRFVDEFNHQRKALTEAGEIVLSIEVVTTQAREDDPQHCDPDLKARLDELHKRKIDLCDYALILNCQGYIGDSTRSEIEYAEAHGKPVVYLLPRGADGG